MESQNRRSIVVGFFLLLGTGRSLLPTLSTTKPIPSSTSSPLHFSSSNGLSNRQSLSPPTSISQSPLCATNNEEGSGSAETTTWELMEDWILQDRVPGFTVRGSGSTSATTTFWKQLKHTIPELSTKTEEELQERYCALAATPSASKDSSKSRSTDRKDDSDTKQQQLQQKEQRTKMGTPFIECGNSPEVLSDWWMDVVEKNTQASSATAPSVMMINGRLSNGSNIWFPLQSAGTVGGDSPSQDAGFSWLNEEGTFSKYVESSAGCIYELGAPKTNSNSNNAQVNSSNNNEENPSSVMDNARELLSSSPTSLPSSSSEAIATTNTGMTLVAVVASSLLSATLAFTAGQASLPSSNPPAITAVTTTATMQTMQQPSSLSQAVTPALLGSGMKYERTVQRDGSTAVTELSIPEQRASQELKVFRDERKLVSLKDKLASDQASLKELRAKEIALGPAEADRPLVERAPRSPKELPVTEQRARAELKIGVDKRRIQRLDDSLAKDKILLKELQKQEKQQSGLFSRAQ